MKNCPSCEREFKGIGDFPRIYVAGFRRLEFPSGLIYTDFGDNYKEKELPKEVLKLFKETEENIIAHEGFVWKREDSPWEDEKGKIEYSRYDDLTSKTREIYESPRLQEYLNRLEGFVGIEVPTREVAPSRVGLSIYELDQGEIDIEGLVVPNLSNIKSLRGLGFQIETTTYGLPHDAFHGIACLAKVGVLAYEGRINILQPTE